MYNRSADSRAFSIIMGKPTKKTVTQFALTLNVKECDEATGTFHAQGLRLWGLWCYAMQERQKFNMPVPATFN